MLFPDSKVRPSKIDTLLNDFPALWSVRPLWSKADAEFITVKTPGKELLTAELHKGWTLWVYVAGSGVRQLIEVRGEGAESVAEAAIGSISRAAPSYDVQIQYLIKHEGHLTNSAPFYIYRGSSAVDLHVLCLSLVRARAID